MGAEPPVLNYQPGGGVSVGGGGNGSGGVPGAGNLYYWPSIDNLTGGIRATDLDAQNIADLPSESLIIVITGVTGDESHWRRMPDASSPVTDVDLGIIVPTNYDSVTRPWVLLQELTGGGGGAVDSVFGRAGAVIALVGDYAAFYQPLDADLTSWAAITRASGFDTFVTTPNSANLRSIVTDETGTSGGLVFAGSPTITTPTIAALANLTTNGFVKTSGGVGTLSVDTSTYLTANQNISLTGDVTGGPAATSIATTIGSNKVTLGMMATMATDSILGRATASTGNVEVLAALPFAWSGGDITRAADSNTETINASAVTYAKMQNVSANSRLLGSGSAGTGLPPAEITVGSGLTMTGTTLTAAGGGAVGGSITFKGNIDYTILNTDKIVATNAAFTALHTWTMPAANTVTAGNSISIMDLQGTLTSANRIIIARTGSDTFVPGAFTQMILTQSNAGIQLTSDGVSKWYVTYWSPGTVSTSGQLMSWDNAGKLWSIAPVALIAVSATSTAGKIVQSDGTNLVSSVATWPTTGNTNSILQFNGTNFVTSTPAWPTSASTANKVVKSDGTNLVMSTETWAVPGTAGQVLRSNATNWLSAALAFSDLTGNYTLAQGPSITAGKLLGRDVGSAGIPQEITLGTNLSMSGTTLNATGGGGTPGGSTTQVQFNNAGAFGGTAGLTWDNTNGILNVANAGAAVAPYYSQMVVKGAAGGNGASIALESTFVSTTQAWFFGSGIGGAPGNNAFRIVDVTSGPYVDTINVQPGGGHQVSFYGQMGWPVYNGGSGAVQAMDTGLNRNAAGVVEINNGTAGTYRDILARGLRSNAVTFANAIASPVEGTLQAFTDSTTAVAAATITGGGSNHIIGVYNGTNWIVSGGTASAAGAGGSTTQVQFNDAGALAGDADFVWDKTGNMLTMTGQQTVNYVNTDYINTAGAGAHLLLKNSSASGQNVIANYINGAVQSKWRSDNLGNVNWVAYGTTTSTGHHFFTGGDYSVGIDRFAIFHSGASVQMASNVIFGWSSFDGSTSLPGGNQDTGFARNAAGVVEVNNGTAGTYRDLKLRNLTMTGSTITVPSGTGGTAPGIFFAGGTGFTGFWNTGSAVITTNNGVNLSLLQTGESRLGSGVVFGWTSGSDITSSAVEIGLARNSSSVVEVNNGTVGTFRDLKAQNVNVTSSVQVNGIATSADYPNSSVSTQSPAAVDVYVAGSNVVVPAGGFKAKGQYRCIFDIVKSAGTGTPVISLRIGTTGTVASDTARITFTFPAGTSVADTGNMEVCVNWRTVGSGTSAVVAGFCRAFKNTVTAAGLWSDTSAAKTIVGTVSGGFDSSAATTIGLSFNGGTAFAGTITTVQTTLFQV